MQSAGAASICRPGLGVCELHSASDQSHIDQMEEENKTVLAVLTSGFYVTVVI